MAVEPPTTAEMSPAVGAVTPRPHEKMRQDLARVLGVAPSKADEWIDQHSAEAAEERIRAHWLDYNNYGGGHER